MTPDEAQRLSEQADAAGVDLSEHLRALIHDGSAATAMALEKSRQDADHAARVEMNQELDGLRAQLDEAWESALAWKLRALELEKDIMFTRRRFMGAVEGVLNVLPNYRGRVLQMWGGLSVGDRLAMLPELTTRIVEWLEDISEKTSAVRFDIYWDNHLLRGVKWLVAELGSDGGSSEAGDAPPRPEWRSVATALEASQKAIEERAERAGGSR